jgi:hydrogenase nickel incorporation protein HypA/HybF
MHELSIANAILDAVRIEAQKHSCSHVTKVCVRVGALSGVEPEALSFGFTALVLGTDLAPLALEIEQVPRRQRCPNCDLTFEGAEEDLACPRCGRIETELAGGDELNIAYLEIDSPESEVPSPKSNHET